MDCLRKYSKIAANSILESVIALCIISACLYVAVLVYSTVYNPKTTSRFYSTSNRLDALFFRMQVGNDSVASTDDVNLKVTEEYQNAGLKQVTITYKDSANSIFSKEYYLYTLDE